MSATIHIAGPAQLGGLYQTCERCGFVLQDYTGSTPMVVEGEDPTIASWPEGGRIGVIGNATYTLPDDRPLDDDETECRPTS
ncbi:hypothetical protein [Acrocarpospora macrocephala]|nr:hypothetical protein [Acrocarpospora macrocephala]